MNVIVLNLNPAYDVFVKANGFEIGKEQMAKVEYSHSGGKGINVMRALNEIGLSESLIVSILFSDNSEEYKKELSKFKYVSKFETKGRIRENLTINDNGLETRISFEGGTVDDSAIYYLKDVLSDRKDSIVVLSGSLPKGLSKDDMIEIIKNLKEKGCKIVIDSRSFTINDILEIMPDLIKPNEEELKSVFNLEGNDMKKVISYFETMTLNTNMKVMISRGEKEAYLIGDNFKIKGNVPKVNVKSTIGAGDSMIAGFVYGRSKDEPIEEAFKYAISFGSAKCLEEGANPPKVSNIERLYKEIKISRM